MSKEYNDIDKRYADELGDFELEHDSDPMWNELTRELDRDKRRPLWILFLSGGLIILFVGLFLLFNESEEELAPEQISRAGEMAIGSKVQKEIPALIDIPEIEFVENDGIKSAPKQVIKRNEINKLSSAIQDTKSLLNSSESVKQLVDNQLIEKVSPEANHSIIDLVLSEKRIFSQNSNVEQVDGEVQRIEKKVFDKNRIFSVQPIMNLPLLPESIRIFKFDLEEVVFNEKIKRKRLRERISLEIQSAVLAPYNEKIEPLSDGLFSQAHQILGHFAINKNISIFSGIEYLQVNEKFFWQKRLVTIDKQYRGDAFFIQDGQTLEFIGDTVYVSSYEQRTRQTLNRHVMWNIPVGLQYNIRVQRFLFGASLSSTINLSHKFEGWILDETEANTIEVSGTHANYKTTLGLGFSLTPMIAYQLSDRWNIRVGLPLRTQSSSWLTNAPIKDAKWKTWGIKLGLQMSMSTSD